MRKVLYFWSPVLLYSGLILYLSSLKMPSWRPPIMHYDKLLHFIEYGVLAWLWYRAITLSKSPSWWVWPLILLIVLIFGALDELYQGTRGYRSSSIYDFMANTLGAIVILSILMLRNRQRVKQ